MKSYYYIKHGDFGNVYSLYWAPADFIPPENWERITRKRAEDYARSERERRQVDPNFAYYADAYIYPAIIPKKYKGADLEELAYYKKDSWFMDGSYIIRYK